MSAEFTNSNFFGGLEKTAPMKNTMSLAILTTEKMKIKVKIKCKTVSIILLFGFRIFQDFRSQCLN